MLLRDLFLFGLNDESFMRKVISEESPEVTTAQLRQKLKRLEAGRATAKYIKGGHDTQHVQQVKAKTKLWMKKKDHPGKRKAPNEESKHPAKKPFKGGKQKDNTSKDQYRSSSKPDNQRTTRPKIDPATCM